MLHKKSLVLGASSGLGACLLDLLPENSLAASRNNNKGSKLDLSTPESYEEVSRLVKKENVSRLVYVAGGGPHGEFFSKPWHSHEWAFNLNAFTPIKIIENLPDTVDFVYIGSAIAERSDSSSSLSYSWSKKLVKEVILKSKKKNLLLFSPPYMDTRMLPKNAWPRLECPELVLSPDLVAKELLNWLETRDSDDRCFDWIKRFPYDLPKGFEI